MIKEKFTKVDTDTISLLLEFFTKLKTKATGYYPARYIDDTIENLQNNPLHPDKNVFVSFNYNDANYYVTYSDFKIELTDYLSEYMEGKNGERQYLGVVQQYCFRFEIDGYVDIIGSMDQYRILLLEALDNAKLKDIEISDEE